MSADAAIFDRGKVIYGMPCFFVRSFRPLLNADIQSKQTADIESRDFQQPPKQAPYYDNARRPVSLVSFRATSQPPWLIRGDFLYLRS